jgi:hypothetical protein
LESLKYTLYLDIPHTLARAEKNYTCASRMGDIAKNRTNLGLL